MIKAMLNKIKEKNDQEPTNGEYVWKLRGTPRKGMVMKKLLKIFKT